MRVHRVSGILDIIQKTGATLLYLPPYSPDFNPIEKMWSKMKTILRKLKARSERQLDKAIKIALDNITLTDAVEWFKSCGYGIN